MAWKTTWSKAELYIIRQNAHKLTDKEIVKLLKEKCGTIKTEESVMKKRQRLGLKKVCGQSLVKQSLVKRKENIKGGRPKKGEANSPDLEKGNLDSEGA